MEVAAKQKDAIGSSPIKVTPQEMIAKKREELLTATDPKTGKPLTDKQKHKISRQIDFYEAMIPPIGADLSKYPALMDDVEFDDLAVQLENAHSVFDTMWQIGKPIFDPRIPTACVAFNKDGFPIQYRFNPFFWRNLSDEERRFVIAHECMHVILKHGARARDTKHPSAANVAMDIVVNHLLTDRFGIDRSKLNFGDMYCWLDTVFLDEKGLPFKDKNNVDIVPKKEGSFEYYFKELMRIAKDSDGNDLPPNENGDGKDCVGDQFGQQCPGGGGGQLVDDHSGFGGDADEDGKDPLAGAGQVINDLNDLLTDAQKADLEDMIKKHFEELNEQQKKDPTLAPPTDSNQNKQVQANNVPGAGRGTGAGNGIWQFDKKKRVSVKMKWVTLIRRWTNRNRHITAPVDQWNRSNRRLSFFAKQMLNSKHGPVFLPSEFEEPDAEERNRIKIWLFLDTSGSCVHYAERFWRVAESIPKNYFDVIPYAFDDATYPLSFKDKKLYGFGGTSFSPIEERIIEETVKKGKAYPSIVLIVSDGHANAVNPKYPERWHFFLTENSTEYCIPAVCKAKKHVYQLSDWE